MKLITTMHIKRREIKPLTTRERAISSLVSHVGTLSLITDVRHYQRLPFHPLVRIPRASNQCWVSGFPYILPNLFSFAGGNTVRSRLLRPFT
jgi:hypothetical protein